MEIRELSAYELLEEREVSDVKSRGYVLRHKKSGARVAVLSNEDDNKVFYIGFRTTPEDETGVPHIIEHTVLCGSDKFPVKDPFVELVKGSLNTFLNAMTYPDKTMYPVASYNDQDFKNLMDVYMDAVFHPNITRYEEIFKQEGWHYEMESLEDPITINGVVYNEMKGAYSSPEEVLQNQIYKALFPDNTYSRDSGGNPVHIPELTYEAYLAFYHKYYHPSNSYIYLYGDMDVAERLDWMDREYLCHYDCQEVDSVIRMQQPFDQVKEVTDTYSIASDDPEENQTYLAYSRVVGDALDEKLYQAFGVLDYALVSAPGAPVHQALIDAGIGEDVYGSFDTGTLQSVFSIVAKNANPQDKEKFDSIIDETLRKVVKEGINKESLLAGINSAEFKFREADFGQYPKGLLYGLECMDSWLFDDEKPFLHLECLDTFAGLKKHLSDGYFEGLVQKYLLDNCHGSLIVIKPERGKNNREEEQLKKRLAEYKESLSLSEKEALVAQTKHLKQYQEEPSPEEDLSKIPMLTRADMKKEALPFSNIEEKIEGIPVVRHEVDTNGIDYITLLFEAEDVEAKDLGYLGLLGSILSYVDTKSYRYGDLANAINIYTGGISTAANLYPNAQEKEHLIVKYEVRVKALEENLAQAMNLVDEILRTSVLDDYKRLSEIVAQTKARLQVGLSSSGHTVSATRAIAQFSRYGFYQDELRGVAFYRSVCKIEELLKTDPESVSADLRKLTGKLFAANRLLVSFTGNEKLYRNAEPVLRETLCRLPKESAILPAATIVLHKQNEGFIDASQIQYVARTGDYTKKGFAYTGAFRILKMILSYDYLWINLRVKGGAYGCMSSFMRTGESYFVSYRDPNLEKTNEVYEHIPDYLENFRVDERDMTKYIIGTFGAMDTPLNPEAKGSRSLAAYLGGITYETVQKERDEVLNATVQDIRNLAGPVEAILSCDALCVIGNENMIKDAAGMFDTIEKLYN
jgi:hypothetical protein